MAKGRSLRLFGWAYEYTCTFISECKCLYGDVCSDIFCVQNEIVFCMCYIAHTYGLRCLRNLWREKSFNKAVCLSSMVIYYYVFFQGAFFSLKIKPLEWGLTPEKADIFFCEKKEDYFNKLGPSRYSLLCFSLILWLPWRRYNILLHITFSCIIC